MATQLTQVTFPNGDYIKDTNTWRGIQDNLTSSTNTTESLSAKQGYLLANGSAKDNSQARSNHRHFYTDLIPTISKTYTSTSYYATSGGSWETSSWYFMSIKPDSWYKPWSVKFKIHSISNGDSSADSTTWCTLSGRADGIRYSNWNIRYNTGHYYIPVYPLKKAGFDAGYGHAVGISILYGTGYTTASYYRTFDLDYYECEGCTVTILDTPVKWASWTGTGTTNYNALVGIDAVNEGLRETGDDIDVQILQSTYSQFTAGGSGIKQYSLVSRLPDGTYSSFTTTNGTGTDKVKTTSTFMIGKLYYMNTSGNFNAGSLVGTSVVRAATALVDMRYSLNIANNTSFPGLTANKPVYIVFNLADAGGGTHTLADKWWSQDLPTTADNKIYVLMGYAYDWYRADLFVDNPAFYHNGTTVVGYIGNAQTVNGHTVAKDVPSNAVFTDHYAWSDITGKPTTLAGYGITDAKISNGIITLGSNTITPLTSSSTLNAAKLSGTIPSSCYTDTNNAVTQTPTDSTNSSFELLFSGTADNTEHTEGVKKSSTLLYNPNQRTLAIGTSEVPIFSRMSNTVVAVMHMTNTSSVGFGIDPSTGVASAGVSNSGKSLAASESDIILSGTSNTWDGTNTSLKTALAAKGTSNLTIGTTATTAMAGNTAVNNVTQTATDSTDATYELLFSGTADNTTRTEGARKTSGLTFNPTSRNLSILNNSYITSIKPTGLRIFETASTWRLEAECGDITLGGTNNTWDGTNTSLKTAITTLANRNWYTYIGFNDKTSVAANTTVNMGSWKPTVGGVYIIFYCAKFSSNATGVRKLNIATTATGVDGMDRFGQVVVQACNGTYTHVVFSTMETVTANTTYYFNARHTASAALDITASGLKIMRIR